MHDNDSIQRLETANASVLVLRVTAPSRSHRHQLWLRLLPSASPRRSSDGASRPRRRPLELRPRKPSNPWPCAGLCHSFRLLPYVRGPRHGTGVCLTFPNRWKYAVLLIRLPIGLLLRASEAGSLLCEAGHAFIHSDSGAFCSRLLAWLVADALTCSMSDLETAL